MKQLEAIPRPSTDSLAATAGKVFGSSDGTLSMSDLRGALEHIGEQVRLRVFASVIICSCYFPAPFLLILPSQPMSPLYYFSFPVFSSSQLTEEEIDELLQHAELDKHGNIVLKSFASLLTPPQ